MHDASFAVCYLRLFRRYDDGSEAGSSSATGFLWRYLKDLYVVTNWHNVTGENQQTGEYLGTFTPSHVEVSVKYQTDVYQRKIAEVVQIEVSLYREEVPIWLEHPMGSKIDVVAIPIKLPSIEAGRPVALNSMVLDQQYTPRVGDDGFVVGYPLSLSQPFLPPVWKRATLATEPAIDYDPNEPVILVDTATREGMSGSPFIVRRTEVSHRLADHGRGTAGHPAKKVEIETFLGVYSGRIGKDEFLGQVGRVWRADVVRELFANSENKR